ncbi:hypothetical protein [Sinomonas halotolerans]|uniref:Uncharacterized protein n=1 Tax=Sinomonas halotolerans TaxID=1644133 RepID=A0ABU9WW28_9MICC
MAHFNGAKPIRPKAVAFPVCQDRKQWNTALKAWIGEIHPEFQHRLLIMQPFTYAGGRMTVLSMLHDLDIQDKHRDSLTVSAELHGLDFGGSFEYEEHSAHAVPWVELHEDAKLEDGTVLGTIHAGAPVRMHGQLILRPLVKAQLVYNDEVHDVLPMLHQFSVEVGRCLGILMSGLAAPEAPAERH